MIAHICSYWLHIDHTDTVYDNTDCFFSNSNFVWFYSLFEGGTVGSQVFSAKRASMFTCTNKQLSNLWIQSIFVEIIGAKEFINKCKMFDENKSETILPAHLNRRQQNKGLIKGRAANRTNYSWKKFNDVLYLIERLWVILIYTKWMQICDKSRFFGKKPFWPAGCWNFLASGVKPGLFYFQ